MAKYLNKGFSLLEILISVFLTAVLLLLFSSWLARSNEMINDMEEYYVNDKNEISEKIKLKIGEEAVLTKNIIIRSVSVNGNVFEYLEYKK